VIGHFRPRPGDTPQLKTGDGISLVYRDLIPLPVGFVRFQIALPGCIDWCDIQPDPGDWPRDLIEALKVVWPNDWMRATCPSSPEINDEIVRQWENRTTDLTYEHLQTEVKKQFNAGVADGIAERERFVKTTVYEPTPRWIEDVHYGFHCGDEPHIPHNWLLAGGSVDYLRGEDRIRMVEAIAMEEDLVDELYGLYGVTERGITLKAWVEVA
jgi:hypothetical protein